MPILLLLFHLALQRKEITALFFPMTPTLLLFPAAQIFWLKQPYFLLLKIPKYTVLNV